jgi:hypothetical protein
MEIDQKYEQDLKDKNFYNFLMKVKTDLRKLIRKENFQQYSKTFIIALKKLTEYNEKESCLDLIKYYIDEFEKYLPKMKDNTIYLTTFNSVLDTMAPSKYDLKLHISNFMRVADKNGVTNEDLIRLKVHNSITNFYQTCENYTYAYKYSLLTLDPTLINESLKNLFSRNKLISTLERYFFVTRAILELVLRQKIDVALELIKQNMESDYKLNHPLINFSFFLVVLVDKYASFENFWLLINRYKASIEFDANLTYYLNQISITYFKKPIIEEQNNMLNNLVKLMSV